MKRVVNRGRFSYENRTIGPSLIPIHSATLLSSSDKLCFVTTMQERSVVCVCVWGGGGGGLDISYHIVYTTCKI